MKNEVVNTIAIFAIWFAVVCFVASILIGLGGCVVAEGEKTTYDALGKVTSHVEVRMTQCMVDSKRNNFEVDIPDLGKVTLGSSILDAEELKGIMVELKPFFIALLGL